MGSSYGLMGIGVGLTIVIVIAQSTGVLEGGERATYNWQLNRRGPQPVPSDIRIVAVDQPSIGALSKSYPIPRAQIGKAVCYLHRAGAKVIGIDFSYFDNSDYGPADDRSLARCLKQAGNVVLDEELDTVGTGVPSAPFLSLPVPPLTEAAAGLGVDNIDFDSDGIIRSAQVLQVGIGNQEYPSFPLQVAALALRQNPLVLGHRFPAKMLINYNGPQTPDRPGGQSWHVSRLTSIVPSKFGPLDNPKLYRNAIVLIIPAAAILNDSRQTPYGEMYGGFIQANVLNTILRNDPIVPVGTGVNDALILLLGMLVTAAATRVNLRWLTCAACAAAVLYTGFAVALLTLFHLWVNVFAPELAILPIFLCLTLVRLENRRWQRAAERVQRARALLVTAREEERRRLRRDLHDGLGPVLASVLLNLNAVRRVVGPQSPADAMLVEIRGDVQAVLTDMRRLVYELRPPTLDELGLAGAVRQSASTFERDGLLVQVEAPDRFPPLPAAVEVAAYRIVQEALTNAVRHAQAHRCNVRLAVTGSLDLEVRDDGVGLTSERHLGVGLSSMQERAAELGGTCRIEPGSDGGTRVSAHLPLVAS